MSAFAPADLLAIVRSAGADDHTALAMLMGACLESNGDPAAVGRLDGSLGVWQLHNDPRGADTVYAAAKMRPAYAAAVVTVDPALWASNPEQAAEQAVFGAERPARDYYATQGPVRVAAAFAWAHSAFTTEVHAPPNQPVIDHTQGGTMSAADVQSIESHVDATVRDAEATINKAADDHARNLQDAIKALAADVAAIKAKTGA
jgi:hypothetical protein